MSNEHTCKDIFGAGKVIDEDAFIKNIENKIRLGVLDENIVASELKAVRLSRVMLGRIR